MRRWTLVLPILLLIAVSCGRKEEAPPPLPAATGVPTPVGGAPEVIASQDLAVEIPEIPEGLQFNQVEPGSMSFFIGGDGRAVMELNLVPGVDADDFGAAETWLQDHAIAYLFNANLVAREEVAGPAGTSLWLVYSHDQDGAPGHSAWLLSPHPDGRRMLVAHGVGPDGFSVDVLKAESLKLIGALR